MKTRKVISYILVIALLLCTTGCKKKPVEDPVGNASNSSANQDDFPTKNNSSTEHNKATEDTQNTGESQSTQESNSTEGSEATGGNETVSVCNHILAGWTVEKPSSCTTEGSRHRACTQCKEIVETEVIPVLSHTPGNWIVDKVATCSAEGEQHQSCTQCKMKIISVNIAKTAHTPDGTGKCTVCDAAIQADG